MRVAQQHRIQLAGIDRERRPVELLLFAATLDEATVEQQLSTAAFDQVAAAGDAPGRAVEGQAHRRPASLFTTARGRRQDPE
jgi:hypothetical protein